MIIAHPLSFIADNKINNNDNNYTCSNKTIILFSWKKNEKDGPIMDVSTIAPVY